MPTAYWPAGKSWARDAPPGFFAANRCAPALLYLGRVDEARALEQGFGMDVFHAAREAAALVEAGQRAEGQRIVRAYVADNLSGGDRAPVEYIDWLGYMLQAAVIADDRESAALLAHSLADVAVIGGPAFKSCIPRHVGDAATLLGDRSWARACYDQALEAATRVRFRPEVALTRLALAELLLSDDESQGSGDEATAHLDFAIEEFSAMGMQPALERALRVRDGQRGTSTASVRPTYPGASRSARSRCSGSSQPARATSRLRMGS